MIFGRKVRTLRVGRGLSQEEFADECGLHRTYIGSVERGEEKRHSRHHRSDCTCASNYREQSTAGY